VDPIIGCQIETKRIVLVSDLHGWWSILCSVGMTLKFQRHDKHLANAVTVEPPEEI
jgi:hypothetical protein